MIKNLFSKSKGKMKEIAKEIFENQFKGFKDIAEESEKNVLSAISKNSYEDILEEDCKCMTRRLS